jgi:hypothetical protein
MFLVSQGKKNKIDFSNPRTLDHRQIGTMNQEIKIEKTSATGSVSTNKIDIKNKIDLKNTCDMNISKMNLHSTTKFNRQFYYTTHSKKRCREEGIEYNSPLEYAVGQRQEGETTILIQKAVGSKTYHQYGNMTIEEIKANLWGKNEHAFEIIPADMPRKMYFDIDYFRIDDEHTHAMSKAFNKLVRSTLTNVNHDSHQITCAGVGMKDGKEKISYHSIIKDHWFENLQAQQRYVSFIQNEIATKEQYAPLRDGVLDFAVYGKNQAFKLPYQSKAQKKIVQVPVKGELTLEDFLITHMTSATSFIDHTKWADIDTRPKKFKTKSNKQITFQFDLAVIVKEWIEAIGKDYKLPPIIIDRKQEELRYYLLSIPNNEKVSRKMWKVIGWSISNITKNSKRGLELWAEWTSKYKPTTIEELKPHYDEHSTSKGYGWKTLYDLARIYNGKMEKYEGVIDQLFEDIPAWQIPTQVINQRYIEHDEFNMKKTMDKNQLLFIKSPMGTGKSWSLKTIFEDTYNYRSVLYLSCKRAFASAMAGDFEEYGFVNYMDIPASMIEEQSRIICSIESIRWCRDRYDLVIIDESESIADNLTGEMIRKNNPMSNILKIYNIIRSSEKVMVMDAYLSRRSFDMLYNIFDDDLSNHKKHYLQNNYKMEKRFATITDDKEVFAGCLMKALKDGQRCVVVCGSKTLSEKIREKVEAIGTFNFKIYDSKNPLPITANVNEEWKGLDLLMYTPTITAGISYTNRDWDYDRLFIYSVNKGSCCFRDTIQAHRRVRHFKTKEVNVCINDRYRGFRVQDQPVKRQDVIELEEKFKTHLFDNNVIELKSMVETKWIYNIHIYNTLETNISQLYLRKLAERYLKEENIMVKQGVEDEFTMIGDQEFDMVYDKIEKISHQSYLDFYERLNDKENDQPLNDDEWKKYIKCIFLNEMVKPNLPVNQLEIFFNNLYPNPNIRRHLTNIRFFKEIYYQTKYNWDKLKECEVYTRDAELPVEMRSTQLKRFELIGDFLYSAGIMKKGMPININKCFELGQLEGMIEKYKDMDKIDAVNKLMKDYKIRTKAGVMTTKTLKSIMNNLVKEEFGYEMSVSRVSKRVNGKVKTISTQRLVKQEITEKQGGETEEYDRLDERFNPFNIIKDTIDREEKDQENMWKSRIIHNGDYGEDIVEEEPLNDPLGIAKLLDDTESEYETDTEESEEEEVIKSINVCVSCGKGTGGTSKCVQCMIKEM